MTASPVADLELGHEFARELPELAVPWQAEAAPDPQLLVLNEPLARELGLDPAWLRTPDGVGLLTGTRVPHGTTPVAQGYAGHQFGQYNPRLGDGRALLLGELTDAQGHRRDLHLKGSGRTPFARGGDGLAALGPMLREHVISEAMHALRIPTTRSLAVLTTGRDVQRETVLPGAVLARVAASHLRVGSFQLARASDDLDLLRRLAELAITRHHPSAADAERPSLALFEAVLARHAALVARWMGVGFVHGVQNTDNVTISGETIDYGPCAFLDVHDPEASFSSIDHQGRYGYGNQPAVAQWNLARLAEALLPLIDDDPDRAVSLATEALQRFTPTYVAAHAGVLRGKLGLASSADDATVAGLAAELLDLLRTHRVDHTAFFRALGPAARGDAEPARSLVLDLPAIDAWIGRWRARNPEADAMDRVNPVYVPRNHLVEEALAAATVGELVPLHRLLEAVTDPFVERPELERYAAPSPADPGYRTFCGT